MSEKLKTNDCKATFGRNQSSKASTCKVFKSVQENRNSFKDTETKTPKKERTQKDPV